MHANAIPTLLEEQRRFTEWKTRRRRRRPLLPLLLNCGWVVHCVVIGVRLLSLLALMCVNSQMRRALPQERLAARLDNFLKKVGAHCGLVLWCRLSGGH